MGICASCLGLSERESSSDPSDTQHLLNDPYPPNHYGATTADHRCSPQVDPEEIRRQRDALERLCAQTSDKLIDVTQSTRSKEGRASASKLATDYSRLFSDLFAPTPQFALQPRIEPDSGEEERRPSSGSTLTDEDETTWLDKIIKQDGEDLLTWKTPEDLTSLSVQFDDILGPGPTTPGKAPRLA